MALTSVVLSAQLRAIETGPNDFGGVFAPDMQALITLVDGVAAGQANLLFIDERTVLTAANDDIDLNGVLTTAFGQAFPAVELVALFLINAPKLSTEAANTTNLVIGGGTNPVVGFLAGTTPTIGPIRPGSFVMLGSSDVAGFGVITAATGDILRITNSAGASCKYQIAILARNA